MKKIAVPITKAGQVDNHFGHCEYYSIFSISDKNEILSEELMKSANGCGCKSGISKTLAQNGVTLMLAGGIGGGAIQVLNHSGIEVIRGCAGDSKEIVLRYLSGLITDNGITCDHHGTTILTKTLIAATIKRYFLMPVVFWFCHPRLFRPFSNRSIRAGTGV